MSGFCSQHLPFEQVPECSACMALPLSEEDRVKGQYYAEFEATAKRCGWTSTKSEPLEALRLLEDALVPRVERSGSQLGGWVLLVGKRGEASAVSLADLPEDKILALRRYLWLVAEVLESSSEDSRD